MSKIIQPYSFGQSYRSMILATTGLVGYWRLGESSGITATDELGTYSGTYTPNSGGAWTGGTLAQTGAITGDADNAALFDGSSGYVASTHSAWSFTEITIECWANVSTKRDNNGLVSEGNLGFLWQLNSANMGWYPNTSTTLVTSSSISYSTGQWMHLAITQDSSQVPRFYKNGALVSEHAATVAISHAANNYIGNWRSNARFFAGTLDEVAVYSAALSGDDILVHYNKGIGA